MYAELLGLYRRELNQIRPAMAEAMRMGNHGEIRRLAHLLKGASMSVGLADVVNLCRPIEEVDQETEATIREMHQDLTQQLDVALERIEVFVKSNSD